MPNRIIGALDRLPQATPSTPATGHVKDYFKSDGGYFALNSAGVEALVGPVVVTLATTANDTLSGLAARDGVTPTAGQLVLVPLQTTGSANGIYVAASGTWARWSGAATALQVASLGDVIVQQGTLNGGTHWYTSFKATDTLGTTAMTWWTPDRWIDYTPTPTGFTVGNGTLAGRYCRTGAKTVALRVNLTAGTSTTYTTSAMKISLPMTAHATGYQYIGGRGQITSDLALTTSIAPGGTDLLLETPTSTTNPVLVSMTTSTFNPGTTGRLYYEGVYEPA